MDSLTGSMKDVAFATSPREFDLSYSTTLEEIMEKLNARRAAFQMPFQIKGGVPGQRISFEKEPNVDVGLWLFLKDGTHIRIQPVITEAKMSVGGMRVDKNSALRKGLKGATVGLATERGGYIDTVTETVKKILNGEEVEDVSGYGINMEFEDKSGNESRSVFRTAMLPELMNETTSEEAAGGLTTALIVADSEEDIVAACLQAWENGADLLYVPDKFAEAYEGLLAEIQGNSDREGRLRDSMERIYRMKYANRANVEGE